MLDPYRVIPPASAGRNSRVRIVLTFLSYPDTLCKSGRTRDKEDYTMKKRLSIGTKAPNFTYDTVTEQSLDFYKTTKGKKAVLFFLRYAGCPVCQLKIRDILRDYKDFKAAGLEVFVILQSVPSTVREALAGTTVPFTIVCDNDEKIFGLYGVSAGNIFQYLAPSVLIKALRAARAGFKHGKKEGNEMQLPAVFIVNTAGTINYAYYGMNIGDVPDNNVILNAARA
jgi:thioredoxin-dependent peroxiredoxin